MRSTYDRTYSAWHRMKQRCDDPNTSNYENYGGRGITYDKAWKSFDNFLADMGDCPDDLSLERLNNNEGYNKNNCVWATRTAQNLNQRIRQDNKSRIKGVYWRADRHQWVAQGTVEGYQKVLYKGLDFFEACCARISWRNKIAKGAY